MKRLLYPDAYCDSAFSIDYQSLWDKGIRGLLFDIDNTLTMHNVRAEKKEANFFKMLEKIGFKSIILSNNRFDRVAPFAKKMNLPFIFRARKPLSRSYKEGMRILGTDIKNSLFIGDQLYTDILGANIVGIPSILVRPISSKEAFWIKMKRIIEKPVIKLYETGHKRNDIQL